MKVYKCKSCLSVAVELVEGKEACEKNYQEMKANTVDASGEKHLPVAEQKENKIKVMVGSIEHPMLEEHHIMWIYLETTKGGMIRKLNPGEKPEAEFLLSEGEKPIAVYEYCNLHGLWKQEMK